MRSPLFSPAAILRAAAALLLLLAGAAPAARAQAPGAVEGVARNARDGAPLSLLLVRLVPVAQGGASQSAVTDTRGRFRFAEVAAGEYRIQVEQIGHERTLSPVLRVEPGAKVQHEIRSTMVPIQLAGITVGGRCLTAAQLGTDARLAALWNEARKGADTRRALSLQYRYTRTVRQDIALKPRIGRTHRETKIDTTVNEPDSVRARERRAHESRAAGGYATRSRTQFTLAMPNELEILSEEFLRDHCLETSTLEDDGAFALRFRPVRAVRGRVDVRGAVWVDARTFLVRRLELDYIDGSDQLAQGTLHYADLPVAGGVARLPATGEVTGHPTGLLGVAFARASAQITFDYRDFERVRPM